MGHPFGPHERTTLEVETNRVGFLQGAPQQHWLIATVCKLLEGEIKHLTSGSCQMLEGVRRSLSSSLITAPRSSGCSPNTKIRMPSWAVHLLVAAAQTRMANLTSSLPSSSWCLCLFATHGNPHGYSRLLRGGGPRKLAILTRVQVLQGGGANNSVKLTTRHPSDDSVLKVGDGEVLLWTSSNVNLFDLKPPPLFLCQSTQVGGYRRFTLFSCE